MSYTLTFALGGTTGTFLPDVGFRWTDRLNVANEANFIFSSSSAFNRSKVDIGAVVLITEGASIEFLGYVDDITTVDGGGLNVHATGQEGWLGREHGAYSGSPWTATNNVTIFNAIMAESSHITAGSSDSFGNVDFTETSSDSLWNAVKNLSEKTSQDLNVVYSSSVATIGLVNTRQSAAGSRDILNYGKEIGDISVGRSMPLGNKVLVYGKGEGVTRIKSAYPAHGYDATSQATWGVITKIVEDYTVSTVAEANLLADAEVARYKDPVKTYEFSMRVKRFKTDFIAGDTITLNATDQGLVNEAVRIVEIEKGITDGAEFMNLTVTNAAFARLSKTRDQLMAQILKTYQQSSTFNQYQNEYSNQNCATCVGGNSCFTGTYACINGNLFCCSFISCLSGVMAIYGAGACFVAFDPCMTVCVPYLQVGDLSPGFSSFNTLHKRTLDMCGCDIIHTGTVCASCFCGAGGGGGSLWCAGTAPYIYPCSSCSICVPGIAMTGDLFDATSTHHLGVASSPGAFADVNAACGIFTTCESAPITCGTTAVYSPFHCGACVCGTTSVISPIICGSTCIQSGGCISGACIGVGGSSSVDLYLASGGIGCATSCFRAPLVCGTTCETSPVLCGSCTYACRRMVLPVGTNCY